MPLSAKEKMKQYREKLKQDRERGESVKKKDRERKLWKKLSRSPQELLEEKRRNRERVAKFHSKNAKKKRVPGKIVVENIFKTPQSLGKSKRKADAALPKSPRKRIAVVKLLAQDVGLGPVYNQTSQDHFTSKCNLPLQKTVRDFYLNQSWMCPGAKDTVAVEVPNTNKKQHVQKYFMLTTLKEAYALFCDENPDATLSFSKFAKLRPQQVLLESDIPHTSCLCKYHENVRLLLHSLKKAGHQIPTTFRDFIALCVCNQSSEICMSNNCANCPGIESLSPPDDVCEKQIEWEEW